jgi:hypothetical protein
MAFIPKDNSGSLFRNDQKKHDKSPDYSGTIMIAGTEKRISAWLREGKKGKYLSLQISEMQARSSSESSQKSEDDLPF